MVKDIKAHDLKAIAAEYGKKPSSVRSAVNYGLLQPAERRGGEWAYPSGSDKALRELFELQERGVRGDALRFSLWWSGRIPFTDGVVEYIVSVLKHPLNSLRYQLKRLYKVKQKGMNIESPASDDKLSNIDPEPTVDEWKFLLDKYIDRAVQMGVLGLVKLILDELDPESEMGTDGIKLIADVALSAIMGIDPEMLWVDDEDVASILGPYFTGISLDDKDADVGSLPNIDIIRSFIKGFHSPNWFEPFIDNVRNVTPLQYEIGRKFIFSDEGEFPRNILNIMVKWVNKMKSADTTTWDRQMMGPWVNPGIAFTAAAIGIFMVGYIWIGTTILNLEIKTS